MLHRLLPQYIMITMWALAVQHNGCSPVFCLALWLQWLPGLLQACHSWACMTTDCQQHICHAFTHHSISSIWNSYILLPPTAISQQACSSEPKKYALCQSYVRATHVGLVTIMMTPLLILCMELCLWATMSEVTTQHTGTNNCCCTFSGCRMCGSPCNISLCTARVCVQQGVHVLHDSAESVMTDQTPPTYIALCKAVFYCWVNNGFKRTHMHASHETALRSTYMTAL